MAVCLPLLWYNACHSCSGNHCCKWLSYFVEYIRLWWYLVNRYAIFFSNPLSPPFYLPFLTQGTYPLPQNAFASFKINIVAFHRGKLQFQAPCLDSFEWSFCQIWFDSAIYFSFYTPLRAPLPQAQLHVHTCSCVYCVVEFLVGRFQNNKSNKHKVQSNSSSFFPSIFNAFPFNFWNDLLFVRYFQNGVGVFYHLCFIFVNMILLKDMFL